MSRYVIELRPDCKVVQQICESNGQVCVGARSIQYLEELTSDYINEHFGDLQDTAYKKGLHDGESKCGYCNEYQRGLNDAWEAARKIIRMPEGNILDLFPDCYASVCTAVQAILKYDTSEAIAKLKAYEEKQKADEEIKVGDLIANNTEPKLKVWVTCFDEIGFGGIAITDFGTVDEGKLYTSCSPKGWHKIGHIDIDKILEGLRYDS